MNAYEPAEEGTCPAFAWIGQRFTTCDRCGRAYWKHTHVVTGRPGDEPFTMREFRQYIPRAKREAVRMRALFPSSA